MSALRSHCAYGVRDAGYGFAEGLDFSTVAPGVDEESAVAAGDGAGFGEALGEATAEGLADT